jgi:hypothetical protein
MKKLVLHIGLHKTGTSSIQSFLQSIEQDSLSEYGFLYPKSCRVRDSHDLLAWSAASHYREGKYPTPPLEEVVSELLTELSNTTADTIVLSSEFFWPMTRDDIASLCGHFKDYDLSAVVYVRNYLGFLKSAYGQGIKTGASEKLDLKYLEDRMWWFDLNTVIGSWKSVIGDDRIHVRVYDKVKNQLIDDFLQTCQLDVAQEVRPQTSYNVTPNDSVLMAFRFVNSIEQHLKIPQRLLKRIKRRWRRGKVNWLERGLASLCFGNSQIISKQLVDDFRSRTADLQTQFLTNHIPAEDHQYFSF